MDAFQLSPIEWVVILTSLTSGAIGALGIGSYLYLRDRTRLKQHRSGQQHHLDRLKRLSSKLLNALDQLAGGTSPEETILYQRFKAAGGEYYDDTQSSVCEALRNCQSTLTAAFDLHQKLIDPDTAAIHPLEQQIWDWEMLFASLIGSGEETQNLTGDELRSLFDPLLDPTQEAVDSDLAEQPEELPPELAGQSLKIHWQQINPLQLQAEGILDYLHHLKTELDNLPERHKMGAPFWLVEARTQRQQTEQDFPSFLPELYAHITTSPGQLRQATPSELSPEQLFRDIDLRLAEIEAAQTMGRFLEVIERSHSIWQDMDILRSFLQAMTEHGRRLARLEAIAAQGYRPAELADDLQEIKVDVQTITGRFHSGDYLGASPWIEKLETDSQSALGLMKAWRELHQQNVADLEQLQAQVAQLVQWWTDAVAPAWEQVQNYAQANCLDLSTEFEQARETFEQLRQNQCDEIESLNSLEVQKLAEAERLLIYTSLDLARVEQQFQRVLNRLLEIQAAERYLPEALRLTEADLRRAETWRDQEKVKIGPEIDRQIEQAREQLAEAERLSGTGEFLAAIEKQSSARQLATATYVTANEQVRQINTLQLQLASLVYQVKTKIERCLTETQQLSALVQTSGTARLARQLQATLVEAEQARLKTADLEDRALVRALEVAIAGYERTDRQAEWLGQQLAADRAEYDDALNQTLALLAQAEAALEQARQAVGPAGANSVGHRALQRAEAILPAGTETEQATRAALDRLGEQSEITILYVRWAESQLRWQDRLPRAKHQLRRPEPEKVEDNRPRLRRLSSHAEQIPPTPG